VDGLAIRFSVDAISVASACSVDGLAIRFSVDAISVASACSVDGLAIHFSVDAISVASACSVDGLAIRFHCSLDQEGLRQWKDLATLLSDVVLTDGQVYCQIHVRRTLPGATVAHFRDMWEAKVPLKIKKNLAIRPR
jgi:hypothetical protein